MELCGSEIWNWCSSRAFARFLTRGGVMTLATWLSKAAVEEQTSVLLLILKIKKALRGVKVKLTYNRCTYKVTGVSKKPLGELMRASFTFCMFILIVVPLLFFKVEAKYVFS